MMTASDKGYAATAAVTASAALILAVVYVAQYGFGLWPCELCYMQRVPYFLILLLGALSLMPAVDQRSRRVVLFHLFGLFAIGAIAALYHAGVEMHWWQGPTACTGTMAAPSIDDLSSALGKPAHPMCDQPAFIFMGITMAGYNFLASVALALLTLGAARRKDWWAAA